jgi:hypothetical protein
MKQPVIDELVHELDIIFPDDDITINGKLVVVREFGFMEGLKLQVRAKPFLDALAAALGDNNDLTLDLLGELFSEYDDLVSHMMSLSTGLTVAEIAKLSDTQGQELLMKFWQVNQRFFVNRLLTRKVAAWKKVNPPDLDA